MLFRIEGHHVMVRVSGTMPTIALLGTMDTKGVEHGFVAAQIRARGHSTLIIDLGTDGPAQIPPDITREQVAAAAGYADPNHWHEGGDLFLRLGYLTGLCALAALGAVAHGTEGEARRRVARWVIGTAVVTVVLLLLTVMVGPESYYVVDPTWPLQ